jgi:hypothetical protein
MACSVLYRGITMTIIKAGTKLTRKTASMVYDGGQDRAVIVTVYPKVLGFRTSGTRQEYKLPIVACLRLAVEAEVESKRNRPKRTNRVSAL